MPIRQRPQDTAARRAQSGQGMLEYVLIVVFIAIAGIVTWRTFGAQIEDMIGTSQDAVSDQSDKIFEDYEDRKDD